MTTSIPKLATAGMVLFMSASCVLWMPAEGRASSAISAAPAFSGGADEGRLISLSSLRGKPVLLVIAPSPMDRAFRSQVAELKGRYERLASQGMICFAAFTANSGLIPSNIPFLTVKNSPSVASSYGVTNGFAVAVIGADGNLDCLSMKPLPGQRILDLVNNNASIQEQLRR